MTDKPLTITLLASQWVAIGNALVAATPVLLELPEETKALLVPACEALAAELHRLAGTKGKGSVH